MKLYFLMKLNSMKSTYLKVTKARRLPVLRAKNVVLLLPNEDYLTKRSVSLLVSKDKGGCFLKSFNKGNPSSEDLKNLENNIKEGSFVWVDGKTAYNKLLEDKHCPSRVLKDHTTYNCVDHLNNINCLHNLIEQWYAKARGIATKYINRYCALWSIRYMFRDCDSQETLLKIIAMLREKIQHFLVRQVTTEDLCLI